MNHLLRACFLVGLLVLASLSSVRAECAEWILCPYVVDPQLANYRYLSLADENFDFRWREIEVSGNQAVVCMPEIADLSGTGCSKINRGQMRSLLHPPEVPFFDGTEIKFYDGRDGREKRVHRFDSDSIKRRISDSGIADDILDRRNPTR